jgi:hypothetical protein
MADAMIERGYKRVKGPQPDGEAVTWWFFRSWEDGFAFARGGRCGTSREARHLLSDLHHLADREHQAWLRRPTHELMMDGSLRPLA